MTDFHWNMREILSEFRPDGRLNVFMCILLHKNSRNRSYPSNELIRDETGFSLAPISAAIKWLLDGHAMVLVPYDKRVGAEKKMGKNKNIYQLTGVIKINDEYHQYWSMNPESWEGVATDLTEIGDNLLSELSNSPDNSLGKYLLSKRKGIVLDSSEDIKDNKSTPPSKPKPKTKPAQQPTVKPSEKKAQPLTSRKKLTPLQKALEAVQPYKGIVHEMAVYCKAGYAMMGDVEHSLSVSELESYALFASEFIRLGGKREDIKAIYEWIDDNNQERNWTIAPTSIVKGLSGWKAEQSAMRPLATVATMTTVGAVSPNGGHEPTAKERADMLSQLRAARPAALKATG